MESTLSLIVCIVGMLLYLVLPTSVNPRPLESKLALLGLDAFWVGLLAFLLQSAPHIATWVRGL